MDVSLYYDPNKLLSYNKLLNFVVGSKGIGKTYGFKKYCVNKFLSNKEKFIYLKRYKKDVLNVNYFFEDISGDFKDVSFKTLNNKLYINGDLCGYIIPLSEAHLYKAKNFNDVRTIIYDDFLVRNKYLNSYMECEPFVLLNFIDDVIKNRTNLKCVCLGNLENNNPYFDYFNINNPNVGLNVYDSFILEMR